MTPATHSTFWLVSDVRRGSPRTPGSGHDITGPDINLNFLDHGWMPSLDAEQGFDTPIMPSPMWPVSLHLAYTKRVSVTAQDLPCSGTAARACTLARLAMNATAVSKSVQTDQVIAYRVTYLVRSLLRSTVSGKPVVAPKRNEINFSRRSVQQMAKSNKGALQNPKSKRAMATASASKKK